MTDLILTVDSPTQDILTFIETVPAEQFVTELFISRYLTTDVQFFGCVLGQIGNKIDPTIRRRRSVFISPYHEVTDPFRDRTKAFASEKNLVFLDITYVNNKPFAPYMQESIKERVVAFLQDMVNAGY